jgi:hypothetical protein
MTRPRRTGYVWLFIVSLTAGCGGVRVPASTPPPRVSQLLEEGDALARLGRYTQARAAYATVLAKDGAPTGADRALLSLARLALDPKNPDKDERQAAACLDRVLREYPESSWATEARTWRSLLRNVDGLQGEVRRYTQDRERLRRDLRREQQETVRLHQERDRLRQIDVELERPVRITPTPSP